MHFRPSQPVNRPVLISLCLLALAFALAIFTAATAHAAYYKTLYCAAADGSGNPTKGARPGFFDFTDDCGTAYGDPAGTGGFLRLEENTTGTAGNTDEASYSWWPPAGTSIAAVSAYTRVPGYFNSGWRSRFWGEGYDGGENNILMQGSGVAQRRHLRPRDLQLRLPRLALRRLRRLQAARLRDDLLPPGGLLARRLERRRRQLDRDHAERQGGAARQLGRRLPRPRRRLGARQQRDRLARIRPGLGPALLAPQGRRRDASATARSTTRRTAAAGRVTRTPTASSPATSPPAPRSLPALLPAAHRRLSDGAHQLAICVQDFAQYQHLGGSASEIVRHAHDPHRQHRPRQAGRAGGHERQPRALPRPLRRRASRCRPTPAARSPRSTTRC